MRAGLAIGGRWRAFGVSVALFWTRASQRLFHQLGRFNEIGVQAFRPTFHFEFYLCPFCQCSETVTFDNRVVDEYIFFAIFSDNEAKPFLIIKPLDSSCVHSPNLENGLIRLCLNGM